MQKSWVRDGFKTLKFQWNSPYSKEFLRLHANVMVICQCSVCGYLIFLGKIRGDKFRCQLVGMPMLCPYPTPPHPRLQKTGFVLGGGMFCNRK